jgi:hypothetical protein
MEKTFDIPNIEFKRTKRNPTIDSPTSLFILPYFKDAVYFNLLENFVGYVKSIENLVRQSQEYKKYIHYLKEDIGLKTCQVLSNIAPDENDNTKVEMHHGPILTLFDYIMIIIDYMVRKNINITTFRVADIVLEEHFNNNIQVVMLSETVHEEVHNNNIFISTKQAFGNLNAFIEKYKAGLNEDIISKINKYISLCEKYDSYDNGILAISNTLQNWNRNGDNEWMI